jgi:hypothetical protein
MQGLTERLSRIVVSLPFLGMVVAVFTWPTFPLTPSPGLDASWGAGLYMAAREGLVFGREIVFTYGPLGFLSVPSFWYGGPGTAAFVYSALLHIAACTLVLWAASRVLDRPFAVIVAILACSFLGPPLVVIALIASATVAMGRGGARLERLFPLLIAALGAFAFLVKINFGVEILLIGAVALLASSWRGSLRRLAEFAAAFAGSLALLWLIAGQPLAALPDYVSLSNAVVSGYSQTMELTYPGPNGYIFLAIALVAGLAAVAWALNSGIGLRRRVVLTGLIALYGFACFKEGFVRQDGGHIALFTSSIVSAWFVLGWKPRLGWQGIGCLVAVLCIATYFQPGAIDPIARIDTARQQLATVIKPSSRQGALEEGRANVLASAAIDPSIVARLGDATVHVDPYEASVAWALGLDWKPLPVFQDYLAFTSTLDRKNADALRSEAGPELILRRLDPNAIDGRLAAFNPPEANVQTLCNYRPELIRGEWALLRRGPDRCGTEQPLGETKSRFGEAIQIPRAPAGSLVTASIHGVGVTGIERVRAQLFRAKPRFITLVPGNGSTTSGTFRLVPGTAQDGLIMSAPSSADYPAPFAVAPNARALVITGPGLTGSIDVEFHSMPIRSLTDARGPEGGRSGSAQGTNAGGAG